MTPSDTSQMRSGASDRRARANVLLAVCRLVVFAMWTVVCYAAVQVARLLAGSDRGRARVAARWTHIWCRYGIRIFGIAIDVRGRPPEPPVLVAPNHLGYLDIFALSAAAPMLFVSKADVLRWPVVGVVFATTNHIAIARTDRRAVRAVNERIAGRLREGLRVCVFLEGTSGGGDRVLPFHASLAEPAVTTESPVGPVALHWRATYPGVSVADDVAYWRDEHVFGRHAWRVLGLRGISVTVEFGAPIAIDGRARKAVAADARAQVIRMLEESRDR